MPLFQRRPNIQFGSIKYQNHTKKKQEQSRLSQMNASIIGVIGQKWHSAGL